MKMFYARKWGLNIFNPTPCMPAPINDIRLLLNKDYRFPGYDLCTIDKVSQFFVHGLAQRSHFTHIYIPFILSLFN